MLQVLFMWELVCCGLVPPASCVIRGIEEIGESVVQVNKAHILDWPKSSLGFPMATYGKT